jgi:hypothetical protein
MVDKSRSRTGIRFEFWNNIVFKYYIKLNCNINPTSRDCWNAICDEFAALTDGKGMWFEVIFPGDTEGYFFRGEPCPMQMPDFNAGEVVQGEVQIIESANEGYQTKVTA